MKGGANHFDMGLPGVDKPLIDAYRHPCHPRCRAPAAELWGGGKAEAGKRFPPSRYSDSGTAKATRTRPSTHLRRPTQLSHGHCTLSLSKVSPCLTPAAVPSVLPPSPAPQGG